MTIDDLHSIGANDWNAGFEEGMRKGYRKAENDYHAQSENDRQIAYDCGYETGYSKAVDDFANKIKSEVYDNGLMFDRYLVDEIAEKLKAGEIE